MPNASQTAISSEHLGRYSKLRAVGVATAILAVSIFSSFGPTAVRAYTNGTIDQCVASIADPMFTKAFILNVLGLTEAQVTADVASGALTVQIANPAGDSSWNIRGNSRDIYCGGPGNDYVSYLDSSVNTRDYFFGGGGNDTITTMWFSTFYGGDGDDSVLNQNWEASRFYGGPGTNACGSMDPSPSWVSLCDINGPQVAQSAITITSTSGTIGSTISLATSGGSGSGAVSYVTTTGTAGCSVVGAVLSATSPGTCAVTATKAASGSYSSVASSATTITFNKASQAALVMSNRTGVLNSGITISLTGGSGSGSVTHSVNLGSAQCSITSGVVSATAVGTCVLTSVKASDSTYLAETLTSILTFSKSGSTAGTITSTTTGTVGTGITLGYTGGSGTGTVAYAVTTTGTANCSINNNTLAATAAGTCTVTATKASDGVFEDSTVNATFTFTAAPVVEIVVVAPVTTVTTVPVGQGSIATIATPLPTVPSVKVNAATTTVAPRLSPASTTSTSTSLPKISGGTIAPTAPSIQTVAAGEVGVKVGDKTESATVQRVNNQYVVSVGALKATFAPLDSKGNAASLDNDGNIRLATGSKVKITMTGFKPGSVLEAWLFSTPALLGTAKVTADGSVSGTFVIPKSADSGSHRIALIAKTTDGKPTTFTVGIMVGEWDSGPNIALWLIVLPLALAVLGALVIPATRRRRRTTTTA